ncbi:DUF6314 family protein [Rhodophyticola porphyridii]|uniref:DUF6314 family protein n=1 Tax=Rhodophyticola porphyridii TaxID=1852017 RepID=UPI00389A2469
MTQIETGFLRYGDAAPMQATRRYLWGEGAGVLRVYFDDGRPFTREPAMRPMPAISACLTYMTCGTI